MTPSLWIFYSGDKKVGSLSLFFIHLPKNTVGNIHWILTVFNVLLLIGLAFFFGKEESLTFSSSLYVKVWMKPNFNKTRNIMISKMFCIEILFCVATSDAFSELAVYQRLSLILKRVKVECTSMKKELPFVVLMFCSFVKLRIELRGHTSNKIISTKDWAMKKKQNQQQHCVIFHRQGPKMVDSKTLTGILYLGCNKRERQN